MSDTVTVPAGHAPPAPPAGTAWQFLRMHLDGRLELTEIPHPDGQPDPTGPPGTSWRLTSRGGVRVYVAIPQPFLHGLSDGW